MSFVMLPVELLLSLAEGWLLLILFLVDYHWLKRGNIWDGMYGTSAEMKVQFTNLSSISTICPAFQFSSYTVLLKLKLWVRWMAIGNCYFTVW